MLRLIYLLVRQRVRFARPAPWMGRWRLRAIGVGAVVLCATLAGAAMLLAYQGFAPAPRGESSSAKATLHVRIEAVGSTPLVVFLESPHAAEPAVHEPAPPTVRVTSVNNAFEPAFQVAGVATRIEVANRDPIPHNAHLFAGQRTVFNVATPTPGIRVHKVLGRPGIFDVRCDFHPWMHAWIFVPPSAHHAVLWEPGQTALTDITPGSYRLHVWEPARGPTTRILHFAPGEAKSLEIAGD